MNAMPANTMAVVTPSYRPDFERFRRLHASVLRFTDDTVRHHVIVPSVDVALYRSIDSPRLTVWAYRDFLPRGIVATDRLAALARSLPFIPSTLNVSGVSRRRPWKPIRGWVLQQLVKLSAGDHVDADALAFVDSDVVVVREVHVADVIRDDAVRFYSVDGAISRSMDRHLLWCRHAHELLGVPWPDDDTFPDYVAGIVTWDPRLLHSCLARVEAVTGEPWAQAVTRYLHISEYILYGTYVRYFGTEHDRSYQTDISLAHSYWSPAPMGQAEADAFLAGFGPDHRAVHIQSTSSTDDALIRSIATHLERAESR